MTLTKTRTLFGKWRCGREKERDKEGGIMKRVIQTALHAIRRSPYQALVASTMASFSFFVAVSFFFLLFIASKTIAYMESRPQVIGYFVKDAAAEQIESAKKSMQEKPYVSSVRLVTQEDALTIFREENAKDPLLSQLVTSQMLPASLEVSAKSAQDLEGISKELEGIAGIEEVRYQKDTISTWNKWSLMLKRAAGVVSVFLLALTTLLIFVVISLRVSAKRKEIGILNVLGASRWYIQGPFVIEGMVYGMIGGFVGWLCSFTALLYLTPAIIGFFQTISVLPIPGLFILSTLLFGLLGGLLIGFLSSFFAVRRFIR